MYIASAVWDQACGHPHLFSVASSQFCLIVFICPRNLPSPRSKQISFIPLNYFPWDVNMDRSQSHSHFESCVSYDGVLCASSAGTLKHCSIHILIFWAGEHVWFIRRIKTEESLDMFCLQTFLFIAGYLKAFKKTCLSCIVMGASQCKMTWTQTKYVWKCLQDPIFSCAFCRTHFV